MTMLVILLLLPRLTLSATSSYSLPEKYYVNCGSDSDVIYGGRTFVGDMTSGGNSVSFTKEGTETSSNQSGSSTSPGIYQTVRIFRRTSSYKFQLDSAGLHFVRLHFSALSSPTEISTARFTVSATSGSNHHFKSFSVQNLTETPRVEEFLLMISSPEFEIQFVPDPSSVALVNAIEVFSARDDLDILSKFDKNLHTVYRLNVGGKKITPENDTLGRTWSLDDDFLYRKDAARNNQTAQKPNYESGSVSATEYTAPDPVYKTTKTMNRSSSEGVGLLMNVTWSLKVKSNTRHFVRTHFCDILSKTLNPDSDFYLYVNGHLRIDVKPSERVRLVTPFYKDVVDVSDGSGLLNVSIGTKELRVDAGFLNGLEVMEFMEKSASVSSSKSSSMVYIIGGCVAAGLILVLSLLFMVFLKRRRSKNKKKKADAEVTVWSPLPLYRGGGGGGSSDNRPFDPVNNSPLCNTQSSNTTKLELKLYFHQRLNGSSQFSVATLVEAQYASFDYLSNGP
ncbi:unnamed protein product [Microthlaspi erraticum]|uniref:Malectin-like domain-containing protein n=1 Tax=Microthlaspi erraticum TaxID=1685480 RepID=A0A6D2JLU2_9BRAS|nr:unnamed protein product [Microthlaspi erraticum]